MHHLQIGDTNHCSSLIFRRHSLQATFLQATLKTFSTFICNNQRLQLHAACPPCQSHASFGLAGAPAFEATENCKSARTCFQKVQTHWRGKLYRKQMPRVKVKQQSHPDDIHTNKLEILLSLLLPSLRSVLFLLLFLVLLSSRNTPE